MSFLQLWQGRGTVSGGSASLALAVAAIGCGNSDQVLPAGADAGDLGGSSSGQASGPCATGRTLCDGQCVDLESDPNNCRACGTVCIAGASCTNASCVCPAGLAACGAACVDVASDPNNCGSCGHACSPGSSCVAGACQCQPGLVECGGVCVNPQSDASNCGGCGIACSQGQVCSAGVCSASCTVPGQVQCGASCVDTSSDPLNCGSCGQSCSAGAVCSAGTCGCPAGQAMCGSQCAVLSSDPANCGACGAACTGGQICSNGACTCPSSGDVWCGSSCVNTSTNAAHCGACGAACGPAQSCENGTCTGGSSNTGGAGGTGGVATGGTSTGGRATGGTSTGGWATGGTSTGGWATGGTSTGGQATGGVATGGTSTGGSTNTSCGCSSITTFGTVSSTIVVGSGETYDGGCQRFIADADSLGDGSSAEGQEPVFLLEDGATLRNVVLGSPAADGIHTEGDATLYNIHWEDIGEDAMTIKESGTVTLDCGSSTNGDDKTFQINAESTFRISNFKASNAGKFARQNGGTTFTMHLYIDQCDISDMGNCIYQTDSSSSTVTMTNTRYSNIGDSLFIGVSSGNITESNNTEY